jgi:hypothetical protein
VTELVQTLLTFLIVFLYAIAERLVYEDRKGSTDIGEIVDCEY